MSARMTPASLYDRPDLYDLVSPEDPAMERFYVETAGGPGTKVLDLACGTGRFTLPIARSGATVTGGDLTPGMLDRARQAAELQGIAVAFVTLDMRDFDLPGQSFDRILVTANSLLHLETQDDFASFFSSARRHLSPGGQLVFDVFVPSMVLLCSDPAQRQILGEFAHPSLGTITVEETYRYDPLTQVSHIDWYWSRKGETDFWHNTLRMRQIFPQELPVLLAANGFRLIERFGDFDRAPLTASSRRQICICAPAAGD